MSRPDKLAVAVRPCALDRPRSHLLPDVESQDLRKINAARQTLAAVQPDSNAISETAY
jgi:hypothetical protein